MLYIPPGQHVLPPLPYPYNALEPVISRTTLDIHYNKHHKAYVDGLNKAEKKLVELRGTKDFSLIKYWENQLAFNGSGDILHSIYWTNMCPALLSGNPEQQTVAQAVKYFGSFEALKAQFTSAAADVEGSGWCALVWQPLFAHLEVLTIGKHQNLTQWGCIPILVIDVWEHAYYLDYQNRRKDYINEWWNIVNWRNVEMRLLTAYCCEQKTVG